MKKTRFLLLLLTLFLLLPMSVSAVSMGEQLSPFIATDMEGNTVDLSTIIGKKPIMLIFWASWCPSCKSEVPRINSAVKKFKHQGMEFIGINVAHNDSLERASAFMNSTGMDYPVIFDETKKLSRQYGVQSVPTIVLVDKKGKVVLKAHATPEISEQRFQQLNQ